MFFACFVFPSIIINIAQHRGAMICVECDEQVDSLYTIYRNGAIQLTDCKCCGRVADKYVEYDHVLLFIDMLLLKPQAYKHLVYNARTTPLHRLRLLAILFEIYLSWAYKEKEVTGLPYNPELVYHTILQRSIAAQYLLFAMKCLSDDLLTHALVHWIYINVINWVPRSMSAPLSHQDQQRLKDILSTTILLSGGMKLLPILMLIWPYDNMAITSTIQAIANVNIVESLRVVTGEQWWVSALVFALVAVTRGVITKMLLIMVVAGGNTSLLKDFAWQEYIHVITKMDAVKGFLMT